jgi:site-specific recombinase XerD
VPGSIVDELATHVATFVAGSGRDPEALIFAGDHGGALRPNNFRHRTWPKAVKASVGLPCHPHDLRHSQASILFESGVHPKTIQVRLGHASIRTTMDLYGHLYEGVDEAAAQALDALHRRVLETPKSRSRDALT